MPHPPRLLGLCGSLQGLSLHRSLLEAGLTLGKSDFRLCTGIEKLPHYRPELDSLPLPRDVELLRQQVEAADALVICCPEYARGIPGAFKNALDWLVGGAEACGLPFALWSPQPRSVCVGPALILVLETLGLRSCPEAHLSLPLLGVYTDTQQIVDNPGCVQAIRAAVCALSAKAETLAGE